MSRLRLRTLVACDHTVVSTWGDIDLFTAPLLRARLSALAAAGCPRLVLNLSRTAYMDSSGLAVLVAVHKALRVAGGELTLVRCRPGIARVLRMTGLHMLFAIEEHSPRLRQPTAA